MISKKLKDFFFLDSEFFSQKALEIPQIFLVLCLRRLKHPPFQYKQILASSHVIHLVLPRLSDEEVVDMIKTTFKIQQLTPAVEKVFPQTFCTNKIIRSIFFFFQAIISNSKGNPFFAKELMQSLLGKSLFNWRHF